MSRVAQADLLVKREELRDRKARRRIRLDLHRALGELGYVESVERFGVDPTDGPYRDGTLGDLSSIDFDRFAIVRIRGRVIPRAN